MSRSHAAPRGWRRTVPIVAGVLLLVVGGAAYGVHRVRAAEESTGQPAAASSPRTAPAPPVQRGFEVHRFQPGVRVEPKPPGPTYRPDREVWQAAQPAHEENPDNPLAGRRWGVYQGPREGTWKAYLAASGSNKALLAKIALRPKSSWLGGHTASPSQIGAFVDEYIANASGGDPDVLVQMALFRMEPWEHAACGSGPGPRQQADYRTWIANVARAIGSQHTAIILQPDLPFWFCTNRAVVSSLIKYAATTLQSLPHTSVYLDAGAADWTMTPQNRKQHPSQAADLLMANGIESVRGFALNSTHYMGTAESIAWGTRIVEILAERGVKGVHFITDTTQNGNPMRFRDVHVVNSNVPDNARVCRSTSDRTGCITLGIPPTSRVGDPRWGLPREQQEQAKQYVDGFLWFARGWLHKQAHWRGPQRALGMARSTSWPGPP